MTSVSKVCGKHPDDLEEDDDAGDANGHGAETLSELSTPLEAAVADVKPQSTRDKRLLRLTLQSCRMSEASSSASSSVPFKAPSVSSGHSTSSTRSDSEISELIAAFKQAKLKSSEMPPKQKPQEKESKELPSYAAGLNYSAEIENCTVILQIWDYSGYIYIYIYIYIM